MITVTLKYDGRNSIFKHLLSAFIQAGAQIVEKKETPKKQSSLEEYQKLFGKRKNDKYSDNEIFVFNSQRHLSQILEKDED